MCGARQPAVSGVQQPVCSDILMLQYCILVDIHFITVQRCSGTMPILGCLVLVSGLVLVAAKGNPRSRVVFW